MTDLTTIDKTVNQFVDGQLDVPATMIEKNCTSHVAGFPIISKRKLDTLTQTVHDKQESYVRNRTHLKEALAKRGVTAKAFLPTKIWEEVCDRTDLFRLVPDESNSIWINVDADKLVHTWEMRTYACLCALAAVGWGSFVFSRGVTWEAVTVFAVCTVLTSLGIGLVCALMMGALSLTDGLFCKMHAKFASRLSLMKHYMPGNSPVDFPATNAKRVTLQLPTPPASVMEVLNKLLGFEHVVRVAAVADAIYFTDTDYSILRDDRMARNAERARLAAERADPIIYVQCGTAVAIIDQFGDFPIEIETVKDCLTLEFLL